MFRKVIWVVIKETSKKHRNKTNQIENRLQNSICNILEKNRVTGLGINMHSSPVLQVETFYPTTAFSSPIKQLQSDLFFIFRVSHPPNFLFQ